MNQLKLKGLLEQFFIEDIGEQDVTSDTLFPEDSQGTLTFLSKRGRDFFRNRCCENRLYITG